MAVDPTKYRQEVIRPRLENIEASLIFDLFERMRLKVNPIIYVPGGIEIPGEQDLSFLDYLLRGTEKLHATAGRYLHPLEYPFFPKGLPEPIVQRPIESFPFTLVEHDINYTQRIKAMYLKALKTICEEGDDAHYGTCAVHDIRTLQDMSRRVHEGFFVAETKYQDDPRGYQALIDAGDTEAILDKLTVPLVEEEIIRRVREKGAAVKKIEDKDALHKIDPEIVVRFYKDKLIPLTKDLEIDYFMLRKQT